MNETNELLRRLIDELRVTNTWLEQIYAKLANTVPPKPALSSEDIYAITRRRCF